MSLDEFRMLCVDAGMISESFTTREIDVCYSQAMMTQIDYLYKKRHLEMNYVEFLEAICRAVNETSIEENTEATLRDKLVALVPNLLSVCPTSVSDVFVKPTEETYFRMMYRPKVY
jgi:ABC-type Fe2+-enterobactin transport system substrate-binding protein